MAKTKVSGEYCPIVLAPEVATHRENALESIALIAIARSTLDARIEALDFIAQVLGALRAELRSQRPAREMRPEARRALDAMVRAQWCAERAGEPFTGSPDDSECADPPESAR